MDTSSSTDACSKLKASTAGAAPHFLHDHDQLDVRAAHDTDTAGTHTAPFNEVRMYAQAASACWDQQRGRDIHMQRTTYDQYVANCMSCLPPMSTTLVDCIESTRVRAARYARVWTMLQLMSTVSQIMGVLLVLGLCSKEEVQRVRLCASTLPAWAVGYALGCLASLPLRLEEHLAHDQNMRGGGREVAVARRLRRGVDFFFGIWFVLGVVWVFGRPSNYARAASPMIYSLCVTLLMLSGLRYMIPIILCCTLCFCLQPTTTNVSSGFNELYGGRKGNTQEHIDATLPIFKFKQRTFSTNHSQKEKPPLSPRAFVENNIHRDGKECCCICLKKYKENAKLRGLPCSHHYHVECIDTWLKVNSSCPICKLSIRRSGKSSLFLLTGLV